MIGLFLSGAELCLATKQFCGNDKAQGAFAFNRMKKVLGQFGLISDLLNSKSFGLLGKQRSAFYEAFDQDFPGDILECLKDAAVYDSRSKISHRSQDLFPSRNGVVRNTPMLNKKKGKKRKTSGQKENDKLLSPLLKKLDAGGSTTSEADLTGTVQEIEEKVRSIKAQRLADAMAHPSYAKLEQEQKDLIKHEWISSLLGLEEK